MVKNYIKANILNCKSEKEILSLFPIDCKEKYTITLYIDIKNLSIYALLTESKVPQGWETLMENFEKSLIEYEIQLRDFYKWGTTY